MLELVGAPEIARMLGVSRRTAWRYIRRGDFPKPAARVDARDLWKRSAVEKWAVKTLPLATDPRRKPDRSAS
jgi:predicted DNA-binding transcriptional regulator AlpA